MGWHWLDGQPSHSETPFFKWAGERKSSWAGIRTETYQPPNAATGKADPKSGMLIEFIINKLIVRSKINLNNTFPPSLSPSQLSGEVQGGGNELCGHSHVFLSLFRERSQSPSLSHCVVPPTGESWSPDEIYYLPHNDGKKLFLPLLEGETLMTKLSEHARAAGSQTDGRGSLSPQLRGNSASPWEPCCLLELACSWTNTAEEEFWPFHLLFCLPHNITVGRAGVCFFFSLDRWSDTALNSWQGRSNIYFSDIPLYLNLFYSTSESRKYYCKTCFNGTPEIPRIKVSWRRIYVVFNYDVKESLPG